MKKNKLSETRRADHLTTDIVGKLLGLTAHTVRIYSTSDNVQPHLKARANARLIIIMGEIKAAVDEFIRDCKDNDKIWAIKGTDIKFQCEQIVERGWLDWFPRESREQIEIIGKINSKKGE